MTPRADMQINESNRTYEIEQSGKRFKTVCRTDGFWSITFTSKNKRTARKKGEEFVSGERTAMRKCVTPTGRAINEAKSRIPRSQRNSENTGKLTLIAMAALLAENP